MTILRNAFEEAEDIANVSSTGHSGDIVIIYKKKRIMVEIKNKQIITHEDITKYHEDLL